MRGFYRNAEKKRRLISSQNLVQTRPSYCKSHEQGKKLHRRLCFWGWEYCTLILRCFSRKKTSAYYNLLSVEMRKILSATLFWKNAVSKDLNDRHGRVIFWFLCLWAGLKLSHLRRENNAVARKNLQVRMVKIKKSRWESSGALKLIKVSLLGQFRLISVKSHFYLPIA